MYVSTVDLAVDLVGRPVLVVTDPAVSAISKSALFRQPDIADRARPRRPKGARTAGARSPTSRHLTIGDMVARGEPFSPPADPLLQLRFCISNVSPVHTLASHATALLAPYLAHLSSYLRQTTLSLVHDAHSLARRQSRVSNHGCSSSRCNLSQCSTSSDHGRLRADGIQHRELAPTASTTCSSRSCSRCSACHAPVATDRGAHPVDG